MNTPPAILLVEDDPVSARFLGEVLEAVPAHVQHAATLQSARQAIGTQHFALWVVDANLPDGQGASLLQADGPTPPALALTADATPERRQSMLEAGFARVLTKPIPARELLEAVRGLLASIQAGDGATPLWNDEQALHAAGGNPASVKALRSLFLAELPRDRDAVLDALSGGDHDRARETLHRLKASCGFVGASSLLEAVRALSSQPDGAQGRERFETACALLLARD